jgi:hypothetical protein
MSDCDTNMSSFISSIPSGTANVIGQNVEFVQNLIKVQTTEQAAIEANNKANNNEYECTNNEVKETFSNCQARYNNNSILMNIIIFFIICLLVYFIYNNFNKNK